MTPEMGDSISKDVCPGKGGNVGVRNDMAKVKTIGEREKNGGVLDVAGLDESEQGFVGDGRDVVSDTDLDVQGKEVEPEGASG